MMHGGGNSDPLVAVKPTNQAERSAAESGAKGGDQGECGPAKRVPDSEPGKRVTGAGTHTAVREKAFSRYTPEVGAVHP
jgi:hypothetical protein